ncbi:MAG: HDOD domain-containing protein [Deltaproteobacteria bacterium]|nr:HDOD domain-containing protein [Deltaproteobacteria bacterium]
MMTDEIVSQIEAIEQALLKESVLGFDPAILSILDDVEIGQDEIEALKSRLGADVFTYLFSIANSAYHGSAKMGPVKQFFDVVNRLGMHYTKGLILQFALRHLARGDDDAEMIFAKDFAASVVGRVMARGLGFQDDAARKVELACLLSNVGALMMMVYRNHFSPGGMFLTDDFIRTNQRYLTERIIHRFQLPGYLHEMIMTDGFILERMGIGLPSVVKLAVAAVDWSFRSWDGRLLFRYSQTSRDGGSAPSLAAIVEEQFAAAGMKKYLVTLPAPTRLD